MIEEGQFETPQSPFEKKMAKRKKAKNEMPSELGLFGGEPPGPVVVIDAVDHVDIKVVDIALEGSEDGSEDVQGDTDVPGLPAA